MRASLLLLLAFNSLSTAQERSAVFSVVRDSQTRQPIEGVTLYLDPYAFRPPDPLFPTLKQVIDVPLGFETVTDAAGRYRYPDLPPHRYCIGWRKQGYWWPTDSECASTMIRTTARRDLTLDRAPKLRGRFLDSSTNTPITGLHLTALQQIYAGGMRQWVTYPRGRPGASAGEFEMTLPPRGEFYLEIIPDDTEKIVGRGEPGFPDRPFYGHSYYPGVTDIRAAIPIVLTHYKRAPLPG